MQRSVVGAILFLSFSVLSFSSESELQVCHIQVIMSAGTPIPQNLPMQVFAGGKRLASFTIPFTGSMLLPPLAPGTYRIQTGGPGSNFFTSGPLHVPPAGPCEMGINITGRATANNQIVDDDVDVEDLRVSPKARAEFEKGFSALQRGDLDLAKKQFLEVTRLAPKLSRAYNVLGVISDQSGDRAAARKYFEKAVELNPHGKAALMNLIKLSMLEKQYEAALVLLEQYRVGLRDTADVHGIAANAYLKLGRYEEAIREARAAHNLPHTNWESVHVIAAAAYESIHEPAMASAEYRLYMDEASNPAMRTEVAQRIRELGAVAQQQSPVQMPMNSLAPRQ
ncbi:MAG TPA: tetratricopeptide repeat protein [Terriglobales bacterium]|nr:tetratricopeptide repeat protein [Terriglobales bacterium]